MAKVRLAGYPVDYKNTGCDLHDDCLTCPFEHCKYDEDNSKHERKKPMWSRNEAVVDLARAMSVKDVAEHFGINPRTVYRILKEAK